VYRGVTPIESSAQPISTLPRSSGPCSPLRDQNRLVRASATRRSYGRGPLHGPVSFPHICVRTDDASQRTVYLMIRHWDGKCANPLSRHLGMEAPALPRPPRRWPGLFIAARASSESVKDLHVLATVSCEGRGRLCFRDTGPAGNATVRIARLAIVPIALICGKGRTRGHEIRDDRNNYYRQTHDPLPCQRSSRG
jgi:hypothetical protein